MAEIKVLKTVEPYFSEVWHGKKLFEVRKNDRNFKVGQRWILAKYDPLYSDASTQWVIVEITYLLDNPDYCLPGFVIWGLRVIDRARSQTLKTFAAIEQEESARYARQFIQG